MAEEKTEELTEDDLKLEDDGEEIEDEDLEEEDKTETKPGDEKPGDEEATLKQRLDELEAENKGLIKSLTAQRGQRQELQNDLTAIKEAIAEARAEATTVDEVDELNDTLSKIPVDFDDDGNMSIDPKYLKGNSTDSEVIKALQTEIAALKGTVNATTVATQEEQELKALLDEKDGYKAAHKNVTKAWLHLKNDLFDPYLVSKGLEAPQNTDQAIDMIVESKELNATFLKKYPNLNLESVVEAHLIGTPRYMRKALDKAITKPDESKHETLDFSKPNSLAAANAGGSDTPESLLDRVANMDTEDYENLPPATLAKIDKLLEKTG